MNTVAEHRYNTWAAIIVVLGHTPPGLQDEERIDGKKQIPICEDGMCIDIRTAMPGLTFRDVYAARELVTQDGVEVPVISGAHLLHGLRCVAETYPEGREKALNDLALLGARLGRT